jgi:hypothetical protein
MYFGLFQNTFPTAPLDVPRSVANHRVICGPFFLARPHIMLCDNHTPSFLNAVRPPSQSCAGDL